MLHCKFPLRMQPSQGDKELVAIHGRATAHKRAAQAAAQKQYEEAVVAQHAELLREEGNAIREALQEKASPHAFVCFHPCSTAAHTLQYGVQRLLACSRVFRHLACKHGMCC